LNIGMAVAQFGGKSQRLLAWPVLVKIDLSPLCNLRCTWCVHSRPNGNPQLEKQKFHASQRMSLSQYRRIIEELRGKASAVSLFYLGDPLQHPDLDSMCRIAADAGLVVHVSTNFSVHLEDDRIRRLISSGVTHLTVCIDGITQETYQHTRVGGRIDWVLENLERVCRFRKELGQSKPFIEVQYLKFQHNVDELEMAKERFKSMGIDYLCDSEWGGLHNQTDLDPGTYAVGRPRKKKWLPHCVFPYFIPVIKYNGDVIPCCAFREGMQYSETDDPRVLGNVFQTSFAEVWNSPAYRELRGFCANPELINSRAALRENFCFGCPRLFETDQEKNRRPAQQYRFEEMYTIGEKGYPVRISPPAATQGPAQSAPATRAADACSGPKAPTRRTPA
jgi:MoaA/NifB/PqqE/SkfB family radical SAM enzyme